MDSARSSRGTIRFGDFQLDTHAGELRKHGYKIKLQDQPFQVLRLLLENPGELVTREELRRRIWPADTFVDFDHGVYNAVKRLREALGDTPEKPVYIETLAKKGYRFVAPIEVRNAKSSVETSQMGKENGRIPWRLYGAALAGVAILVGAAGVLTGVGVDRRFWSHSQPNAKIPGIHSVAVLPFQNLSADPGQEYFTDGMTEELITNLSKIKALRVISRTSVMPYKGSHSSLREIAKDLGVDAIVEGTVQRSDDQVRITARLVYVAEEKNLWAQSYEQEVRNVLLMQSRIAREIAGSIHAEVSPEEKEALSSTAQVDPQAYDAYLKGDQYWAKFTDQDWRKSKEYFELAIRIDPKYARAYSALAGVLMSLSWKTDAPPDVGKIRSLAEKALELDPNLDDPHIVLGWVDLHEWKLTSAEKEFEIVTELAPNNAHAQMSYYSVLQIAHKLPRPVPDFLHLKRGNPTSPDVLAGFGSFLVLAGEYERAEETCRGALAMQPDFAFAHSCVGRALLGEGKPKQAIPELQEASRRGGDIVYFASYLGQAYAAAGRRQEALKVLQELEKRTEPDKDYQVALIYSALGDKERTLASLEKSFAKRDWDLVFMGVEPSLASFRTEPRFQKLASQVGIPL